MVFGGLLTPPQHEIVDCGAFFEVTFFCISPKKSAWELFSTASTCKVTGAAMSRPASADCLGLYKPLNFTIVNNFSHLCSEIIPYLGIPLGVYQTVTIII